MKKGYVIDLSVDEVKKTVETALNAEGVKLPVMNQFINVANADFPGLGYALFGWWNKGDATTLMVETCSRRDEKAAYDLLFGKAQAPKEEMVAEEEPTAVNEAAEEEKSDADPIPEVTEAVEMTEAVETAEPDNGALSIAELGLKGNAAKAFAEGSGCSTLAEVAKLSVAELQELPGVGTRTVSKIVKAMAGFGFELK